MKTSDTHRVFDNVSDMPINLETAGFDLDPKQQEYVLKRLDKIDRWSKKFPQRRCQVSFHYQEHEEAFRCTISFQLPSTTLTAHAEERDVLAAFDRTRKRVLRQLNEFKHVIRREHHHQSARRTRHAAGGFFVEDELAASARAKDIERFRHALGHQADELRELVRAELAELRLRGHRFELTTNNVLDTALRAACERYFDKPPRQPRLHWLLQVAIETIDAQIPHQSTDTERSDLANDSTTSWNIFSDLATDEEVGVPEGFPDREQVRDVVERRLSDLPRDWRRAFRLHFVDGLSAEEIAELVDLTPEQVGFRLRGASEFVRDHVEELRNP